MKKALLILLCLYTATSMAQSSVYNMRKSQTNLGIGTGINATTGALGLTFSTIFDGKSGIGAGAGFSTWGNKFNASYINELSEKFMLFGGIGYSTGRTFTAAITDQNGNQTGEVFFKLLPISFVQVGSQLHFYSKNGGKFYIDFGLAFALSQPEARISDVRGTGFSSNDVQELKEVAEFLAPGGIILGFGYAFNLQ